MSSKTRRIVGGGVALAASVALAIPAAGAASALDLDFGSITEALGSSAPADVANGTIDLSVDDSDDSTINLKLTQDDANVEDSDPNYCRALVVPTSSLDNYSTDKDLRDAIINESAKSDSVDDAVYLYTGNDTSGDTQDQAEDHGSYTFDAGDAGDYSVIGACYNNDRGHLLPQQDFTVDDDGDVVLGGGLLGSLGSLFDGLS